MIARARGVAGAPLALVALIAFLVSSGCSGTIPSLGGVARIGQSSLPIGPEKESEIGFGIAAMVAGRYGLVEDTALTRYVTMVGLTVAEQSARPGGAVFRFGILDTDEVNAFAAPGGYVFVTRGTLELMESEAELAGVLAHEVAHVDETHVLDEIRRSSAVTAVREEAELSGELLDRLGEIGTSLLFTGLSREDELEADSLGLLYAAASGYRPDGLTRFLERLDALSGEDVAVREWTATHPPESARLAALERQMQVAGFDPGQGRELVQRFREHIPGG
jgi:predicted Zn-dependent protease